MSSHRFFVSQDLHLKDELDLEQSVSRHIMSSLRLGIGTPITLFNGSGGEYAAHITRLSGKRVTVQIETYLGLNRESDLNIHLGIVLSRGDRMDYAIQKVTELGVTRITPLHSERCTVKLDSDRADKKLVHWRRIIASACEQSGRNIPPVIEKPAHLSEHLIREDAELKLMLDPDGAAFPHSRTAPNSVCLLTGPEGGFSSAETASAIQHGYLKVQIGPRILRAETAPVIGLGILQSTWGDLRANTTPDNSSI